MTLRIEQTETGTDRANTRPPLDFGSDRAFFLLGAGASRNGGLPLSRELTELALVDLAHKETTDFGNEIELALNYVCGALIKYDTDRGGSPIDLPDIERLVSAVELLSQKDLLEVSPFVDVWDPLVDRINPRPVLPGFDSDFALPFSANGAPNNSFERQYGRKLEREIQGSGRTCAHT